MSFPLQTPVLPVTAARGEILAALEATGALILSAPPGTGKSTQVPRWLLRTEKDAGQVLVLQPRRIAARALAARVAEEHGDALGKTIGYQVRFESASGPETRVLFQTYGMFRQRLARDPELKGVHTVVLDEFHERAWEADLCLLWCRHLRATKRPDLKLVVMSATLDGEGLAAYLPDARTVSVEGRAFPVTLEHQPPRLNELLPQQVLRALKALQTVQSGSVLVFLPGAGEIKWCGDTVAAFCREQGLVLRELHGSLPLQVQQDTLRIAEGGRAVILTTNVAETSLTVPGVTAVIDAGLHRVASYDAERDLNTLYLRPIALANAVQRAGRAGRTAPGTCIRLWDAMRESVMAARLEPEIRRIELSETALAFHVLRDREPGALDNAATLSLNDWPTVPEVAQWSRAEAKLERIAALRKGAVTALGKSLLNWPAAPDLARVLHDASGSPDRNLRRQIAGMAAILSSGKRGGSGKNVEDLFVLGEDLATEPKTADREALGAYRQFLGLMDKAKSDPRSGSTSAADETDLRQIATKLFLPVYTERLAARLEGGNSFQMADGRKGVATAPAATQVLIALEIHESGGKDRAKQTTLPLFLPVEATWVRELFPEECVWTQVEEFDDKKGQLRREERLMFRGLILERREKTVPRGVDASEMLLAKLRSGEIALPIDEEAQQWIHRIKLAHRVCPESGMPELGDEDWELIWHEAVTGKKSLKQLEDVNVSTLLKDYLGYGMVSFLEREAPTSAKVPGPRRAKITYFEKSPPEISARLGDFVGMQGRYKVLMGRQDVTYDILAPNYRTVQKTSDLTAFWKGSYIEIRKELKRRYPKHPWPEPPTT
jgi:ATP-dependent helicase HrpB